MARSVRLALVLPLLLLISAPLWAKDAPEKPVRMADATRIVQRNLALEFQGQRAGGVAGRQGYMKDGSVLLEETFLLKISRGNGGANDVFVTKNHSLSFFDKTGAIRWAKKRETEAGIVKTIHTRYTDTHVDIDYSGPGSKFSKRVALPKSIASAFQVFRRLLPLFKRGEKAEESYVVLDEESQVFDPETITIVGETSYKHGGESHPGYRIRSVSKMGAADLIVDKDFVPMYLSMMGVIEAKWIDESPFEFSSAGWQLSSYVPVTGLAPMAKHLESLEVTISFKNKVPGEGAMLFDNRYQKVKADGDTYRVTLSSTRLPADAKALARPVAVTDEAVKRYLAATPLSQSDDPAIVAKAKEIVGGEKDTLTATRKIVLWVYRTLEKKSGARGNATAVEVLKSGIGDCSEHAALTVALCRAAGIPARNIGGLEYLELQDHTAVAGYHAWAEVWLGQWMGIDATIPQVGTGARYIQFEIAEPGQNDDETAAASASMVRAIAGGLQLRIDAYRHEGGERVVVKHATKAEK